MDEKRDADKGGGEKKKNDPEKNAYITVIIRGNVFGRWFVAWPDGRGLYYVPLMRGLN